MKKENVNIIDISELEENSVYLTIVGDIVQIKEINEDNKELHIYNISERCNIIVQFRHNSIIKKIR